MNVIILIIILSMIPVILFIVWLVVIINKVSNQGACYENNICNTQDSSKKSDCKGTWFDSWLKCSDYATTNGVCLNGTNCNNFIAREDCPEPGLWYPNMQSCQAALPGV